MRYQEEVVEELGLAGDGFEVVIYMPHNDPEYLTIGLDTPDGRRADIDEAAALDLATMLTEAPAALAAARKKLAEEAAADDED
jgi:hypothetical protein